MPPQIMDITGEKFTKLVVIEINRIHPKYGAVWTCQCDCGGLITTRGSALRNGTTKSCRLCVRKSGPNPPNTVPLYYWSRTLRNAENRNLLFEISIQDAQQQYDLQNGKCALSGENITFSSHSRNKISSTASLDRIDSSKGYISANIQWLHKSVNKMKRNFEEDYFLSICDMIASMNNA